MSNEACKHSRVTLSTPNKGICDHCKEPVKWDRSTMKYLAALPAPEAK